MAATAQSTGTTPLEPTEFWDAYTSLGKALRKIKRLTDQSFVDVEAMLDSLHEAYGYMGKAPIPEEMRRKTAQAMGVHEAQLDGLEERVNGVWGEIRLAIDALGDCVTLVDGMREFDKNAKAWGQLEEVKRGLKEASSGGSASSVIENIDEAMKQLKHNASIAFFAHN
jgi:hypothetical protein